MVTSMRVEVMTMVIISCESNKNNGHSASSDNNGRSSCSDNNRSGGSGGDNDDV